MNRIGRNFHSKRNGLNHSYRLHRNMSNRQENVLWRFSSFTITKREFISSFVIIAVMLIIGFQISDHLYEKYLDKLQNYNTSEKIPGNNVDAFNYSMETNSGYACVEGTIKCVDTVAYPDMNGEYMSCTKVTYEWTKHETTTKDENGKEVKKETWSYDEIHRESIHCKEVTFLENTFKYGQLYKPAEKFITSNKSFSGLYKYEYYGSSTEIHGTLFAKLGNNTVSETEFHTNKNIEQTLEYIESSGSTKQIIFWLCWVVFIAILLFIYYYADNRWLENNK